MSESTPDYIKITAPVPDALDAADRAAERAEAESAALRDLLAETERERDRLRWGVVANAGRCSPERKPRWAHVAEATGEGSTSAHRMCVAAGFDPDEVRGILDEEGDGGDNAECDAARRDGAEAMREACALHFDAIAQELIDEDEDAPEDDESPFGRLDEAEYLRGAARQIRALPLPGDADLTPDGACHAPSGATQATSARARDDGTAGS